MTAPMDRLQALDLVEKDVLTCLSSAGLALQELSKDKPSQKQMDQHNTHFLKTLNNVEIEMAKHINYLTQVSTGQAHEGSSYASQKVLQMAWHRTSHARSKVEDLEKIKLQSTGQKPYAPGAVPVPVLPGRPGQSTTPAGSSSSTQPPTPQNSNNNS